ncbi:AraC family transcriptional regulator [Rhizobium sp. YIM 134829]|uniref:AraC family transcriptional regulator n=1 Tax=Rhizobium sp. YIM 134829 TaxID=3390453 RepID=UPI00397C916D
MERLEARFRGHGFSPHRHDTYALGLTLHGVQTFRYRGIERFSQPGQVIVLHPDEVHDGAAGTEAGLIYRMIYVPPELIGAVEAHRRALPFAPEPVVSDAALAAALSELLADLDHAPAELLLDDVMARIAAGLARQAGAPGRDIGAPARAAVLAVCDMLRARCGEAISSLELEAATGLDRYDLARQFRRLTGTSPHRYQVMRRLDLARQRLRQGSPLAQAAAEAGFADQAHFTRHFRKAFGMTPAHWLKLHRA